MDKELFNRYLYDYIKLLSSYLNDEKLDDFSLDKEETSFFIKLASHHSLKAITYKAISYSSISTSKEYLSILESAYLSNVRKVALFEKERKDLYSYMEEKGINYLPLKGLVVREYYPDINDREYADYDIMFDDEHKLDIKAFFDSRGYTSKFFDKSNHDIYLKDPFYNFEMHRDLFASSSPFRSYYEGMLSRSLVRSGYEHYLSDEDFYIYFSAHSYKHYINAGCGIRTLIDYYLFLKNHKDLDFVYIDKELEKLGLLDFSKEINSLSIKLFSNKELSDSEKDILLYIASSGTYGTITHHIDKELKKRSKASYILSRAFPPMRIYKIRYPRLYKTKILIPVAWFMRICAAIFRDNKRTKAEVDAVRKHKKK